VVVACQFPLSPPLGKPSVNNPAIRQSLPLRTAIPTWLPDFLLGSGADGVGDESVHPHFRIVLTSLLVLTALLYIFVAVKTLRGKRPLVLSSRWGYGIRSLMLVSISGLFAR
jgi:hypothetical protein